MPTPQKILTKSGTGILPVSMGLRAGKMPSPQEILTKSGTGILPVSIFLLPSS
jgi:hypothetical protein